MVKRKYLESIDYGSDSEDDRSSTDPYNTGFAVEDPKCQSCDDTLKEPYIRCAVCVGINICPPCFAQGMQFGGHSNCHAYSVITNTFPLLEPQWTAREELQLQDALMECGYGNWVDIAKRLHRTPTECQLHYDKNYIVQPVAPELQQCGLRKPSYRPDPLPPYMVRICCENPPRHFPVSPYAGYNALRSDFEVEFDNNFSERELSELTNIPPDDDDSELVSAMQAALVGVYNDRLQERARRKRIIRNHGLIQVRKNMAVMVRYTTTLGRNTYEALIPFMQLLTGCQFDYLIEGLHYQKELEATIARLCDLRYNGIKHSYSIPVVQKLFKIREEQKRERRNTVVHSWRNILPPTVSKDMVALRSISRKQAPPLEIAGMPQYEKLSPVERDMCSHVRLVPENYIEFRGLLVNECRKHNGIKLAQARRLIKIDVNKTRKLFDFLTEQGIIFAPPPDQ